MGQFGDNVRCCIKFNQKIVTNINSGGKGNKEDFDFSRNWRRQLSYARNEHKEEDKLHQHSSKLS